MGEQNLSKTLEAPAWASPDAVSHTKLGEGNLEHGLVPPK